MAAATVDGRTTSQELAATQSHTVALPDGIATGDLVTGIITFDLYSGTVTLPSGWTEKGDGSGDGADRSRTVGFYRVIDGTEGFSGTGDTITITTDTDDESSAATHRISGHDSGTAPEVTTTTGNSDTPDSDSITPAGGSDDYLFLHYGGSRNNAEWGSTKGGGSDPTGYSNVQQNSDVTSTSSYSVEKTATTSTEDPGVMDLSVSRPWVIQLMAIYPAAAGGGAQTVNVASAAISLLGIATDITLGAVSRSIAAAAAPIAGQAVTPTTGAVSRAVGEATVPLSAPEPTRSTAVSVDMDAAALPLAGPAPTRTVGAVSRSLDAAIARLVGQGVTPTAGAVSRTVDAAAVALIGQAVDGSVGAAGAQTVDISPAGIALVGPGVARTVGAVSRTLGEAVMPLVAPEPTTAVGVVVTVDPATLALASAAVGREVGAVTLDLGAASIPVVGVGPSPATGAVSRSLDVAKVVLVSPEVATSIATGQSVSVEVATLSFVGPEPQHAFAKRELNGPLTVEIIP